MQIVDAQLHVWAANTPQRPWPPGRDAEAQRPYPVMPESLLLQMDLAGVARAEAPVEELREAIAFLDRRAAPGDVVYHNFWIPFAPLYYFRPHGTYIEGLDPIFLYRFDPRLFAGMLSVYRGDAADPHRVIAADFGARFVFVQKVAPERAMARALLRDQRFRSIYNDPHAVVFEVLR